MKQVRIFRKVGGTPLFITFLLGINIGFWLLLTYTHLISLDAQADPIAPDGANLGGFGILGDSGSDEYRADDNRGGEYAATTLNWMELLVLKRGLNFGAWGTWGEPRRTGYAYNWARSGATAEDLITSGQHTGLAQQVADGQVSNVFIWIGANDFDTWNGTYEEIYNGSLSDAELQAKINGIVADITTAVDTLLKAGEVKIIVATIADKGVSPDERQLFPDPSGRQRVTDAINQVNSGILAMTEDRGIGVADVSKVTVELLTRVDKSGFINVGGVPIKFSGKSNDPHYMRLDDSVGHPGTVASGVIVANTIFIEPFNSKYGLGITPLSDDEILETAGLSQSSGLMGCLSFSPLATLISVFTLIKWWAR